MYYLTFTSITYYYKLLYGELFVWCLHFTWFKYIKTKDLVKGDEIVLYFHVLNILKQKTYLKATK